MSKKTNKTNHVLNLLSSGVRKTEEKPAEENIYRDKKQTDAEKQEAGQIQNQPEETPSAAEKQSSVSVVYKGDNAVADKIKETLEEELITMEKEEEEQKTETPPAAAQMAEASTEPVRPDGKEPEPVHTEAPEEEDDFFMVNVMERLVKERASEYIRQFHMCGCRRCLADVTALALTELPAKYVVINKRAVSPLMNFYTMKYAGRVTVEVTKACVAVQNNPFHSEKEG